MPAFARPPKIGRVDRRVDHRDLGEAGLGAGNLALGQRRQRAVAVIDQILDRPQYTPVNADGKVLDLPSGLQLLACGWSNHTPWQTPREESEDELYARLDTLAQQVRDPRRAVFMIHVPPHDSGLDTAPLLDENLRPTVSAGDVLRGPVGSTAVRRLIETYQPLVAIHGHIHESGGERKIGKTLCINPGSEANHGILRGYLVDIGRTGIKVAQRVEG